MISSKSNELKQIDDNVTDLESKIQNFSKENSPKKDKKQTKRAKISGSPNTTTASQSSTILENSKFAVEAVMQNSSYFIFGGLSAAIFFYGEYASI